jgi:hypothetical protein
VTGRPFSRPVEGQSALYRTFEREATDAGTISPEIEQTLFPK